MLVYGVRTYLISPFQVFGPSMCDTLNYIDDTCQSSYGEYLIVNKAIYRIGEAKRGDVIVFDAPHLDISEPQEYYIKRVIGLPGERVEIRDGRIYIHTKDSTKAIELNEIYLNETNKNRTFTHLASRNIIYPVVPENKYFVMGDNRQRSTDSRTCFESTSRNGCADENRHFLPKERIAGKAWFILWPFDKARILKNPSYSLDLEI